jgi:calpain-7
LGQNSLYPQIDGYPTRSENGRHVLKLLLNGAWRSVSLLHAFRLKKLNIQVVIDSLLPYHPSTNLPLHATSSPLEPISTSSPPRRNDVGPLWIPLVTKGYFKALGGSTLRGSDPAPDIYALSGWIPERISLKEGFKREKEWERIWHAWNGGKVLVTLGTGKIIGERLVALHAYGVIGELGILMKVD